VAAYILADLHVTDPVRFESYRAQVPAMVAAHGGRYLVRGGATTVLEGDFSPQRTVVLEFPDMAHLRAFYASPAYQPLIALRQSAATGSLIAVEGL
jgi:uncharacterized protein (DUF1330 family)